jgi:proteasome accessory factor C
VLLLQPGARWLLDTVDADEIEELPGGAARVRLRTDAPRWLARLALMAAGDVEVESPDTVRHELVRTAERTRATYEGVD